MKKGFTCPKCSRPDTGVVGGERRSEVRVRYRKCHPCGHSFTTIETSKQTRHTAYAEAVDTLADLSNLLDNLQTRIAGRLDYLEKLYGERPATGKWSAADAIRHFENSRKVLRRGWKTLLKS
tara:strand:- start:274 stop:639 length:366 start_codon:yes stop_codon:yes gene_type:complete